MANVLYDGLFASRRMSECPLLILEDGRTLSYLAFLDIAARFANAIRRAGAGAGDRLVLQAPKSAEALAVYAACVQAGVALVPLNTAYTADEIEDFVGDAAPAGVVCDPAAEAVLAPIAARHGAALFTLGATGEGSLTDAAKAETASFEPVERNADDLAAILYTSGTTGRAKGAMMSHGNLLANAEALAAAWRFDARDVQLHALPIFHTHGLFVACNIAFLSGGSMIFLARFDSERVIERLPEATAMMGVPTFYTRLLAEPAFTADLVRHVRLFVSGSAPLLAETHRAFEARTGHRILERYGMSETGMIATNPYDGERRAGTVGHALPGVEVRIAEPGSGTPLDGGAVGMVEVRGPNVFSGYWNMPDKTAESFRADGWFVTGDLGLIDGDGYLQIVGRDKDLIISGGFNVYPKEVELVLDAQSGVAESAVIGAPHPDFGEGVVGVLVPADDAGLDVDAVARAIRDRIARFKQPKAYYVVDELPRNAMGKVQKSELRQRSQGAFGEQA